MARIGQEWEDEMGGGSGGRSGEDEMGGGRSGRSEIDLQVPTYY